MTRPILKNRVYLYLTEFFAGMAVMAVELGASRLLAPYFSSSQIVWTIIIGTIMIAMALVLEPALRIADEPTTALDVTTQAQILKLVKELQTRHGTGVLFITHDFGVVAEIADRVAVLRLGDMVEARAKNDLLSSPEHAYTRMLIASVQSIVPRHRGADELLLKMFQLMLEQAGLPLKASRRLDGRFHRQAQPE